MSDPPPNSLADLLAAPVGTPLRTDLTLLVREVREASRPSVLVLSLHDEKGERVGTARVYSNEWYPGSRERTTWSHYFPTLRSCLAGLAASGARKPLRLQVLKAVLPPPGPRGSEPVLLKFIIAPEWAVNATTIEHSYGCPLRAYYGGFIGVSRDPRRESNSEWVAGNAIHAGYRAAAQAYVRGAGPENAGEEYLRAVVETWISEFPAIVGKATAGPTKFHTRPVHARESVLERCRQQWEGREPVRLLQERLFYSPKRGLAGKADRISHTGALIHLHEVKTGASGGERDPATGRSVPGGLQAAAYYEIMRALGQTPDAVYVEQLTEAGDWEETTIGDHPVVSRARATRARLGYDRYIDLIAQNRNIAYCLESGLLTGYDRTLINAIAGRGRSPVGVGGDYDLQGSIPPCRMCEADSRKICAATSAHPAAVAHDFFRHLPDDLWAYWVWFHRALASEAAATRTALYHLVTTPPEQLERTEGVTVANLGVRDLLGRRMTLGRQERIDTRLREEDRVLLTPQERKPGEIRSVEGTVVAIGDHTLELLLNDPPDAPGGLYRVDRLGYWHLGSWQVLGLTDFLLRSVQEATAAGRKLALADLPPLSRRILGDLSPGVPGRALAPPAPRLNEEHRRAIQAALGLEPGDLLLVQGPPGTGKTEMIAHFVRHAVARRFWQPGPRPVLLLANTHRAADELTLRLHERFPDLRSYIVRVGRPGHGSEPAVREHILAERVGVRERLEDTNLVHDGPAALHRLAREGRLLLEHAAVFVGTLAAARAAELKGLEFEWVVVDEAGQATEPAALQALRHMPEGYASRLLLVGDHMQLPPVVPEEVEAQSPPPELTVTGIEEGDGLRTSMFERLARRWPHAVLTLHEQYRMNTPICRLVSDTYYDGALLPGTEEVAGRSLTESLEEWGAAVPQSPALDPAYPVVFIDTSEDDRARERMGTGEESRDNLFEARLIARLVWELSECVPEAALPEMLRETGVISAYRRQNNLIRQELRRLRTGLDALRVDTVDRFQGGERDALFLSLVNNSPAGGVGPLHADARRMNVAVSRARRKLVIVGNRRTFTAQGRPEEEPAKERYRRLFAVLDELVAEGRALVLDSREML